MPALRVTGLFLLFSVFLHSTLLHAQDKELCSGLRKIAYLQDLDPVSAIAVNIPHVTRRAAAQSMYNAIPSATSYSSDAPPFVTAKAKPIVDPQEGLLAKVMAIRAAKHTIDFSTYILKNDESGKILLNELKEAYERGVDVRILVDSLGSLSPHHAELKALFNANGGNLVDKNGNPTDIPATLEVKVLNSMFDYKGIARLFGNSVLNLMRRPEDRVSIGYRWRNRRSHDKLLLTDAAYWDRATAIMGGRNISNSYYGVPEVTPDTYHDMEILVRSGEKQDEINEFATQIQSHYERLFYHSGNKKLGNLPPPVQIQLNSQLEKAAKTSAQILSPDHPVGKKLQQMIADDYLNTGLETSQGKFVNQIENLARRNAFANPDSKLNPLNKPNGSSLTQMIAKEIREAKKSVDIVSPYLYIYPEEIQRLKNWLAEDPERRIRIITNSLYSADNVAAQALTDREVGPMFIRELGEFGDRAQLLTYGKKDANDLGGTENYGKVHAKFAVIDGETSFVVSSNGDPRSRHLNSELGYMIKDGKQTAETLSKEIEVLVDGSYKFGSKEWEELRNHPKLKMKRWMQKAAYPLIQLFQLRATI